MAGITSQAVSSCVSGFSLDPQCPQVMIFGFFGSFLGLALSPYLSMGKRDMCFVDAACIHQTNKALMQRGGALEKRGSSKCSQKIPSRFIIDFSSIIKKYQKQQFSVGYGSKLTTQIVAPGINGIGGFLLVSKELRILWSQPSLGVTGTSQRTTNNKKQTTTTKNRKKKTTKKFDSSFLIGLFKVSPETNNNNSEVPLALVVCLWSGHL